MIRHPYALIWLLAVVWLCCGAATHDRATMIAGDIALMWWLFIVSRTP